MKNREKYGEEVIKCCSKGTLRDFYNTHIQPIYHTPMWEELPDEYGSTLVSMWLDEECKDSNLLSAKEKLKAVKEKIIKNMCQVGNYELVMYKYQSDHADDDYLFLVLARNKDNGRYLSWIFNDSSGGLSHEHYELEFLKEALDDMLDRQTICGTSVEKNNPAFLIEVWEL